jgi:hypothetical protein
MIRIPAAASAASNAIVMRRDVGQVHAAGAVLNEEQHVQPTQQDGVDVEEVDREDRDFRCNAFLTPT